MLAGVAGAVAQKITSAVGVMGLLAVLSHALDAASFGLVSLYLSFQLVLSVFDLGLSTSASRDFSSGSEEPLQSGLMRAYESWIGLLAVILFGLIYLIFSTTVSADAVQHHHVATLLVAASLALELPTRLYVGIIIGRDRQATSAGFLMLADLLRWTGAGVVAAKSGQAVYVLAWQAFVAGISLAFLSWYVWRVLLAGRFRTPARTHLLLRLGRHTLAPLAVATLAGGARLYADRVYAMRVMPVEDVGAYVTAFTVAGGVALVSTQASAALLPRLARHNGGHQQPIRIALFKRVNRAVGVVTSCLAVCLLLAADHVLILFGLGAERSAVFTAVLPPAVLAAAAAAWGGPTYSLIVAEGRYKTIAAANLLGLAAVCAGMIAMPSSPLGIACLAVLAAVVVLVVLVSALWAGFGGSLAGRQVVSAHVFTAASASMALAHAVFRTII